MIPFCDLCVIELYVSLIISVFLQGIENIGGRGPFLTEFRWLKILYVFFELYLMFLMLMMFVHSFSNQFLLMRSEYIEAYLLNLFAQIEIGGWGTNECPIKRSIIKLLIIFFSHQSFVFSSLCFVAALHWKGSVIYLPINLSIYLSINYLINIHHPY